jgi:hypothetical protein
MAQTLARHSDVRLTLGIYTHVELENQTAAIAVSPGRLNENTANRWNSEIYVDNHGGVGKSFWFQACV